MKKLIFAVLWLLIIVPSASPTIINVPGEVSTIQGAINSAMDGDTVLVAAGIYYENINFLGKGILVASNFIFDKDTATISATIIDGSNPANTDSGSVVCFVSGEDSSAVITGFTLRNGSGTIGDMGPSGGGIYVHNSSPMISSNRIEKNRTEEGGGIFSSGGSCKIMDNAIIGNFSGNGGGMYCEKCSSVRICSNTIECDTVMYSGAGIVCDHSAIIISSNKIIGTVSLMSGPSYGGGICCTFSSGLIESNYLAQNTAGHGGGIFSDCCMIDMIGNFVHQNNGLGAICAWMDTSTTIANNILSDNDWVGIYCDEGVAVSIANNTIYGGSGAGMWLGGEGLHINNNIISNVLDGWGIQYGGYLDINHNDFWNNPRGACSDCQEGFGDTTWGENLNGVPCDSFYNILRDPMLMDPQAGDFHLSSNSSCIDAGNNAVPNLPPTDFEGKPRVVDGNGDDSAVVDMGALEYHLNQGDVNQDGVINTADVVYLINYLFIHGPVPDPLYVGDCNCDEVINSADVIYLINYLFVGGPPPC